MLCHNSCNEVLLDRGDFGVACRKFQIKGRKGKVIEGAAKPLLPLWDMRRSPLGESLDSLMENEWLGGFWLTPCE